MSADYARGGGLPDLKRGAFEETKDYSFNNPNNSMLSGAYGTSPNGTVHDLIQYRRHRQ